MYYRKPAQQMMQEARNACQRVAEGPFTPVVFEYYELIGGEKGWALGYPSETVSGHGCICWTHQFSNKK
jgi:hypothetical protein